MGGGPDGAPVGVVVVDKPPGWTSHDVVGRVRRLLRTRRVGHAGTLDPMATGVLVVGVGWATRLLTHLVGHDKDYLATVRLGVATVTDDAEGEPTGGADASALDGAALEDALERLRGQQLQRPSSVSAVKVDGRRSYARVRAGEAVELEARPVTVERLDVLAVRGPGGTGVTGRDGAVPAGCLDVDVVTTVSAGTYVRALARDLGAALGVGGHLTALRRTRSGPFTVADAVAVPGRDADDLAAAAAADELTGRLLDLPAVARRCFPVHEVDAALAARLRHGQRLPPWDGPAGPVAALDPAGDLVALVREERGAVRPVLVVPPDLQGRTLDR
ncbi:tRNA pseudouridine(55) synthase TruB [Aquipuribacter nitratireducens]|uniref:tRNA pseudouridine synthase B n=1 Tax=Aquipuribacter nitratireducens TaxID=650104 RepID=A0ABW0GRZ0_9MICO